MKKRAHESANRIETTAAVYLGRNATLAVLCLGVLLSPAGVTLAQQPPAQEQQRPGKAPAKAPATGQAAPPVGPNRGGSTGANPGGPPPPKAPQGVVWTLGHPPERLRLPGNPQVEFTVSAGDKDVKDVRLAQSTLQDATTFFQLDASQLELCADDGKCGAIIDIPANTTRRLTLKISPAFHTPGIFTGEVAFRVPGKPETQSFKLTVYSRCGWAMLVGGVVISAGLALYFLVNVWLRRKITVDDALFPAYQLRDTVTALQQKLANARNLTHAPFVALTQALNQLDAQLAPQALEGRLPSVIILPWTSGTAWLDNFKAYLAPIADKTGALVVLVNSGVQSATAYWATNPAPVTMALNKIDALAPAVTNAATAQAQLTPILQALQAAVNPPQATALAPFFAAGHAGVITRLFTLPPDTHTLQVRLLRNTLWVWWLVALIALASGLYSVVLQNFGFGSFADYMKCFFWGLGFSVAGSQLEQLTQTSVAGNFGINIPKA